MSTGVSKPLTFSGGPRFTLNPPDGWDRHQRPGTGDRAEACLGRRLGRGPTRRGFASCSRKIAQGPRRALRQPSPGGRHRSSDSPGCQRSLETAGFWTAAGRRVINIIPTAAEQRRANVGCHSCTLSLVNVAVEVPGLWTSTSDRQFAPLACALAGMYCMVAKEPAARREGVTAEGLGPRRTAPERTERPEEQGGRLPASVRAEGVKRHDFLLPHVPARRVRGKSYAASGDSRRPATDEPRSLLAWSRGSPKGASPSGIIRKIQGDAPRDPLPVGAPTGRAR
jgi:hypothetical protein